jgi:hypothetical protein
MTLRAVEEMMTAKFQASLCRKFHLLHLLVSRLLYLSSQLPGRQCGSSPIALPPISAHLSKLESVLAFKTAQGYLHSFACVEDLSERAGNRLSTFATNVSGISYIFA